MNFMMPRPSCLTGITLVYVESTKYEWVFVLGWPESGPDDVSKQIK